MRSSKKNCWLLTGLIAGGVAGGVAAVIIANKKHNKMLDDTRNISGNYLNIAREKGEQQIQEARDAADRLISSADEILELSKKYAGGEYSESKEEFKKELENIRKRINET